MRLHKAKQNANGTFSIGKTWNLEDLRQVEVSKVHYPSSLLSLDPESLTISPSCSECTRADYMCVSFLASLDFFVAEPHLDPFLLALAATRVLPRRQREDVQIRDRPSIFPTSCVPRHGREMLAEIHDEYRLDSPLIDSSSDHQRH